MLPHLATRLAAHGARPRPPRLQRKGGWFPMESTTARNLAGFCSTIGCGRPLDAWVKLNVIGDRMPILYGSCIPCTVVARLAERDREEA